MRVHTRLYTTDPLWAWAQAQVTSVNSHVAGEFQMEIPKQATLILPYPSAVGNGAAYPISFSVFFCRRSSYLNIKQVFAPGHTSWMTSLEQTILRVRGITR